MQKLLYLMANGLAALMDFCVGCLIATLVALVMGHPLVWWEPIVAGAVFSLLPDYDIVPYIVRRALTGHSFDFDHHQTLLHWPMFVTALVLVPVTAFFGQYWGITAFLCVFGHYIHDAVYMENGLAWILRTKPTFAGDTAFFDPDEWIERNWLQVSTLSAIEMLISEIAAGISAGIIAGSLWGLVAGFLVGVAVAILLNLSIRAFWSIAARFKHA